VKTPTNLTESQKTLLKEFQQQEKDKKDSPFQRWKDKKWN